MKTGFIGAGKVGCSLGKFFCVHGLVVTGYVSRHQETAQEAARFTDSKACENLQELIQISDALFLTVPDDAILDVCRQLSDMDLSGKQIIHCSGSLTAREVLYPAKEKGAEIYSIHPLFPVSDRYTVYRELGDAFFCLEGEGPHLQWWAQQISDMGPHVKIIPSESKTRYHAACAISSNLVCALVDESLGLLKSCGFSEDDALSALAPLLSSNMDHIIENGPLHALTGPVERCDTETVRRHLTCLKEGASGQKPELSEDVSLYDLYRITSGHLSFMAAKKHPDKDYSKMKRILEGEE